MLEPASILQRDVDVKAKASEQVEGGGFALWIGRRWLTSLRMNLYLNQDPVCCCCMLLSFLVVVRFAMPLL